MIFDQETADKLMSSNYIKGSDFEGDGLTLKFKSVEKIKGRFGAEEDSKMVERGILEEGETMRYTFEDSEEKERIFDSASFGFALEMNKAEVNEGDWLSIKRTGKAAQTRYSVEHVTPF